MSGLLESLEWGAVKEVRNKVAKWEAELRCSSDRSFRRPHMKFWSRNGPSELSSFQAQTRLGTPTSPSLGMDSTLGEYGHGRETLFSQKQCLGKSSATDHKQPTLPEAGERSSVVLRRQAGMNRSTHHTPLLLRTNFWNGSFVYPFYWWTTDIRKVE